MEFTCFCHDKDHEQCYDGLIGLFDEDCSCCRDTATLKGLIIPDGFRGPRRDSSGNRVP